MPHGGHYEKNHDSSKVAKLSNAEFGIIRTISRCVILFKFCDFICNARCDSNPRKGEKYFTWEAFNSL